VQTQLHGWQAILRPALFPGFMASRKYPERMNSSQPVPASGGVILGHPKRHSLPLGTINPVLCASWAQAL